MSTLSSQVPVSVSSVYSVGGDNNFGDMDFSSSNTYSCYCNNYTYHHSEDTTNLNSNFSNNHQQHGYSNIFEGCHCQCQQSSYHYYVDHGSDVGGTGAVASARSGGNSSLCCFPSCSYSCTCSTMQIPGVMTSMSMNMMSIDSSGDVCRCEDEIIMNDDCSSFSPSNCNYSNSNSGEMCVYCGQKYEDCTSNCTTSLSISTTNSNSTRCVSVELDNEIGNYHHHNHNNNEEEDEKNMHGGVGLGLSCSRRNYDDDNDHETQGGVYMNGEIGSSIRPVGDTGMVYPVNTLTPPGPHYPEPHGIMNGMIMSQDLYGEAVEAVEHVDGVDNKQRFNSHGLDASTGQQIQAGHTPDIPINELKRMLLQQLEYYFSPENLAVDKYLVTQMDQDHYVLIATLATFNMVKKLTSDIDLVTAVLRESKNVQVHADGKRVRPVSHRTVVILRGISSLTSEDEIKNIFENDNCPKCTGCEFAFNDSWYVTFESDEDAMQAHRYLREDVREFKGQPIMARIKSRPTTLLSQGVSLGVPAGIKNGYSQPAMYMPPPFVPSNQQTGATSAPASLYAAGQQVHQNVFQQGVLPSNYAGFGHWPYFDMNAAMFSLNGLQPQGSYGKSNPMNPRSRNLNPMRGVGPRRTMSSGSDTQAGGGGATTVNNSSNGLHQHHQQQQQQPIPQQQQQPYNTQPPRKNNNGAPVPAPLLSMAPPPLVSHPPPPHNHSNHHHPSAPQHSLHNSSNQASNGGVGRNYNNSYSQQQNLPHVSDNYHYTRPYRGAADPRPRSSIGPRRGPPRRDEDGSYDYHNTPAPSSSTNYRGNPSTRTSVPSAAVSPPQIPPPVSVSNHNPQIDLDLDDRSFPPLPGVANASNKNGDSPYEGRLSDVVKGVKSMRMGSSSIDKEEFSEIVVSAAEPLLGSSSGGSFGSSGGSEVTVSAASPQKEEGNDMSSHFNKKEYREIGVGSADENNDTTQGKIGVVSGGIRQMADKSTRTDENLLNGDQPGGTSSISKNSQTQTQQPHPQTGGGNNSNGGYRKSVTSQGGGSKSPIPVKRGVVPPFQTVSMGVGPDVPYTSLSSSSYASPLKPSPRGASFTSSSKPLHSTADNNRPGGTVVGGANSGGGSVSTNANTSVSSSSNNNTQSQQQPSTADKDAFPNFVKVPIASTSANNKPFSGVTDHTPKLVRCEDERRESGQGDGKKTEDCSNSDDGPVRLSYAQVAQSRKDTAHPSSSAPPSSGQSSSSTSSSTNALTTTNTVAVTQPISPSQQQQNSSSSSGAHHHHPFSHQDERNKGRGPGRDNKDNNRAQSRTLRGNGDRDREQNHGRDRDRDRDRDRGYRSGPRGPRSRVTSDASDVGSNSGHNNNNNNNKPPIARGPRSPK